MLTLIVSDLKSKFKNPITWFVIIILCTLSGVTLLKSQKERVTRPFVEHNVLRFDSRSPVTWSEFFINDKQKAAYPIVYESLKLYDSLDLDAEKAILEKDYNEMT